MNKNIINNAQLLEIKTKIRQLGAMMKCGSRYMGGIYGA